MRTGLQWEEPSRSFQDRIQPITFKASLSSLSRRQRRSALASSTSSEAVCVVRILLQQVKGHG
jgi:hypothetical protein